MNIRAKIDDFIVDKELILAIRDAMMAENDAVIVHPSLDSIRQEATGISFHVPTSYTVRINFTKLAEAAYNEVTKRLGGKNSEYPSKN